MTKILIVDDEQQNQYLLQVLLTANGFQVELAANGAEALERARRAPPDVIVSDILMPVMDGFTLCRLWKEDARLQDIPFIFYTATYTDPKDEDFALSLGAELFIVKPLEPERFLGLLRETIKARKGGRPAAPRRPVEEAVYYKEYNAALIRKLEDKLVQLGATNRTLELDIVARQKAEARLRKLNRMYAMQSGVTQASVRIREPQALFDSICRIAVETGGFRTALIGLLDESAQQAHVVAQTGGAEPYLEQVGLALRGQPAGDCPIQNALRRGRHMICNSIVPTAPCQKTAFQQGVRSLAAFPLLVFGKVRGAVAFYCGEADFFDDEEIKLLDELALDVSFAMEFAEKEAERKRVEEARQKLQEQMIQAQKMESVGRLAGGIAHDFNNMLGVILGYAEIVLAQLGPKHQAYPNLKEIQSAAERAADLTRQLLTFARKQTNSPKALNLNDTMPGMLKMLQRLIGEDIKLIWKPGAGLWPIKMDSSQLDQILDNLCVNARDAIAGVGQIVIETANVTVNNRASGSQPKGLAPGEYVMLSLRDTGCGMDQETLAHIFEPFFTTKGKGGTGLGLATVYGVVKQNGGFINVDSKPKQGTTFEICFPRHTDRAEQDQTQTQVAPASRGQETVLLVEDEPGLLILSQTMLEALGYQVLSVGTPSEAVRVADEHTGAIQLLMSDVVMPGMNGMDLSRKIQKRHPRIKPLFMSGYTADVIDTRGVVEEGAHFLQKPFTMNDLAAKVRAVLDQG